MSKYKLYKFSQIVENSNYIMTQEEVCERLNDLEVKLAEAQELKQQLAENQKKKEDFETMYFNKCLDYEHLHEKFDDKCAEFELKEYDYKQTIFEKDQDKISFAVEQLEKVKKEFNERKLEYITMETKTHIYGLRIDRINELIDNQINELKGMVKKNV